MLSEDALELEEDEKRLEESSEEVDERVSEVDGLAWRCAILVGPGRGSCGKTCFLGGGGSV